MWERLLLASRLGGASRDQTITVLKRLLLVAGKPLPREIHAKLTALTALGPTPAPFGPPQHPLPQHRLVASAHSYKRILPDVTQQNA
jgi:hypothetical protein